MLPFGANLAQSLIAQGLFHFLIFTEFIDKISTYLTRLKVLIK